VTTPSPPPTDEPEAVRQRYARRAWAEARYSLLNPVALRERQGRQRAMACLLAAHGLHKLGSLRLTEVGCGTGGNLLELLQMGFAPEHLHGIELLPERHAAARRVLPEATTLWLGDACLAPMAPLSQDLLLVATVFSSLLDDAFQQRLAETMWGWVKPGGGVIWYDFTLDNPRNTHVRGVPLKRVRALFPQGHMTARRLTLAPPLARVLCKLSPRLLPWFDVPLLRTHVLAWIAKPA
jgi:SAM-dependent methyltransferase